MNYNEKMLTLSQKEMLDLWKTRLNLTPARRDCNIEREDGIDIDKYLLERIDEWYAKLLSEAPDAWLPIKDIAQTLSYSISPNGVIRIAGDEEWIRPVKIQMKSWRRAITQFHSPNSFMALLQFNEYTCGGSENPVAIIMPTEILMYNAHNEYDTITEALFITRPAPGFYSFAESAMSLIPLTLE